MNQPVEYLDLDDLLSLTVVLLGEPPPVRDLGLLSAAVDRPRASAFGEPAYPDIWSKASALMHSIVRHHPLIDGNKRLGWLATAVFLEINGIATTGIANDAVYDFVYALAEHDREVTDLAAALRKLVEG